MEIQATRDTGFLNFEKAYLNLRQQENRILDDEELAKLPRLDPSHPHYHEWKSRQASGGRLKKYMTGKKHPLKILEIGCGNGWLSHQLSFVPGATVTGSDINSFELEQAQRVFGNKPNLHFLYGDIYSNALADQKFNIVVFAASLQYFDSFPGIINKALSLLEPRGEIHILDTYFYATEEIEAAQKRSIDYFTRLGFPEMSAYYYHHGFKELENYSHRLLYKPKRFPGIFQMHANPFYWISITGKRS